MTLCGVLLLWYMLSTVTFVDNALCKKEYGKMEQSVYLDFLFRFFAIPIAILGIWVWPVGLCWGTWQYHPEKMLGTTVFGTHLEDVLWWFLAVVLFASFIAVSSEHRKKRYFFLRSEASGFWQSFRFAVAGLQQFRKERNLAIMASIGIGALIIAACARSLVWLALIAFICFVVLAFEMMNSSIEKIFDCIMPYEHPLAKKAKDMMAGASLLVSCGALAVGILFLYTLFFEGR